MVVVVGLGRKAEEGQGRKNGRIIWDEEGRRRTTRKKRRRGEDRRKGRIGTYMF